VRSGHGHTRRLLAALFADGDACCYTTLGRATGLVAPDPGDVMHLHGP
jgi:hypothetical protein